MSVPSSFWLLFTGIFLSGAGFAADSPVPPGAPAAPKAALKLKVSMRDGLRFEPPRLVVSPGSEVTITVENADSTHQTHNFVVVNPGKLQEVVQQAMELGADGPAKNFVPASAEVLGATALLDPETKTVLKFKVPAKPGIYPYVCTFPGHGMIMYGAMYSGVTPPPLSKDPNLPPTVAQSMIAGNGVRPFVQRMFMPDAGPAAIAVALPGTQNYCWDAGACRLRYVWDGAFIDASEYWKGNGKNKATIPHAPWWSAKEADLPLRSGSPDAPAKKVTFLGYKIQNGLPEFRYRAGDLEVFEKITPGSGGQGVAISYRIPNLTQPLFYRTGPGRWSSSAGTLSNNVLTLTPEQAANFTLTLSSAH